jgi:hypothetical protein
MAQILSPLTFTSGQVLTAADLNAHVNSATLLAGHITDQTAVTAFDIQSTDIFNIYDTSGAVLRKATVDDLMRSGMIATFNTISGKAGQNLTITPASTYAVAIIGNLTSSGTLSVTSTSTLTGDVTAGANLTVTGLANFNTTEAIKIPVGTTAQRPASPVVGQIRFNSTLTATEIYNGTTWDAVPVAGTNLTLPNTVNFTGAIQFNGTPVYALSAVTEETIPNSGYSSGILFTSSPFTKPSDEIWHFEIEGTIARNNSIGVGTHALQFINTSGVSYSQWLFYFTSGSMNQDASFKASWVVNSGTALTVETVRVSPNANSNIAQSGVNKFRIYKYRTA